MSGGWAVVRAFLVKWVQKGQTYHRCPACACVFTSHIAPEVMATENNCSLGPLAMAIKTGDAAARLSRLLAAFEHAAQKSSLILVVAMAKPPAFSNQRGSMPSALIKTPKSN